MDEINIYGSALTAGQVAALYNSVLPVANALPTTTPVSVASGATLDLAGNNQTIFALSDYQTAGNGGSVTNSASTPVTLTLNTTSGSSTFSGVIGDSGSGGALTLVKTGAGTQILAGANTYSGPTNIQAGILALGTSTGSNVGSLPAGSVVTLGSGTSSGILQLGDASNPVNMTVAGLNTSGTGTANAVVGGNAAISTLTFNVDSTFIYKGGFGGTGTNQNNLGVTKTGAGVLTITGNNTIVGPTIISNGTLRVGPNFKNGSFEAPVLGSNSLAYYNNFTSDQFTAFVWSAGGNPGGGGPALVNGASGFGFTNPYPNGVQAALDAA